MREEARPLRSNTIVENGEEVRREDVLETERANLELRRNFFVIRAAKTWNELPDRVKTQRTVNGFKNAYDTWKEKGEISNTNIEQAVEQDSTDVLI